MIASATRGSRRMFLSFCRPLAVFTMTKSPSMSHHTGVTWGEPSGIRVPRLAKARLPKRSRYLSGIDCDMSSSLLEPRLRIIDAAPEPGRWSDCGHFPEGWAAASTIASMASVTRLGGVLRLLETIENTIGSPFDVTAYPERLFTAPKEPVFP